MLAIGIDIVEIDRIRQVVAHWGERFLNRVYTRAELDRYQYKPSSLAARFAGKEAVIKALGRRTGWREIEILSGPTGQPLVRLYGKAQCWVDGMGLDELAISLSHSREYAVACVAGTLK